MMAYELLARCRHLTLCGVDEYGELEWLGTLEHWNSLPFEEERILSNWEVRQMWKHAR